MHTLTVLLLCHMRLYISCKLGRRWYLTAVQAEFRVRGMQWYVCACAHIQRSRASAHASVCAMSVCVGESGTAI